MADIKKFLDKAGVSVLWNRIAEELEAKQIAIENVKNTADTNKADIVILKRQIETLEGGTYDDSELRGLIEDNTDAIAVLNKDAATAGSVAHTATAIAAAKVAEIVANADANFDTLKEIADWILNDTSGAADMINDIKDLQIMLVGVEGTVVGEIAAEIEAALRVGGVDKYALASDLLSLADRVKAVEDAGYQNAEQVGTTIDAKIAALKLAESYDTKGAAATAETNAKAYTDTVFGNIQALTTIEIEAAIDAASQPET